MAAQVWLLLGAALAQYAPDLPPTPPQSPRKPSKNLSAPSGLLQSPHQPQPLSSYSFPSSTSNRPVDFSPAVSQKVSPVTTRSTSGSVSRPPSYSHANATSRRLTPTSSTSSSPRHLPVSLPPVTPRRSSFAPVVACSGFCHLGLRYHQPAGPSSYWRSYFRGAYQGGPRLRPSSRHHWQVSQGKASREPCCRQSL